MTRVSCENEWCIYQKEGTCTLERVQLDIQGNCADCIYVHVEQKVLDDLKEELLRKM